MHCVLEKDKAGVVRAYNQWFDGRIYYHTSDSNCELSVGRCSLPMNSDSLRSPRRRFSLGLTWHVLLHSFRKFISRVFCGGSKIVKKKKIRKYYFSTLLHTQSKQHFHFPL